MNQLGANFDEIKNNIGGLRAYETYINMNLFDFSNDMNISDSCSEDGSQISIPIKRN